MGDRNNIKVTYHTGDSVYLYSHWGGSGLRTIVRDALDSSGRVSDESYFTRVLFSRMIAEDINGETGYGIATYPPDQDYGNDMIHIDYSKAVDGLPEIDWAYKGE
jgi:hypothetical protein